MDLHYSDGTVKSVNIDQKIEPTNLVKIVIHDGVKKIPDDFVDEFNDLREFIMPDSVVEIGELSLRRCSNLKNIVLSQNLKTIGRNFLQACTSLENIDIPNKIEKIGKYFLFGCSSLKSLNFSTNVKVIPNGFAANCKSLKKVKIFGPIKNIIPGEKHLFGTKYPSLDSCDNLEDVEIISTVKIENIGKGNHVPEHAQIFTDCPNIGLKQLEHVKKIVIRSVMVGSFTKSATN